MQKIRRDDEIIVIAGKDKGKRGKVLKVLADDRLIVGGINLVKRHTKPIAKNPSASLWDIGDGVVCLEFTSKMNAMDPQIIDDLLN